MKPYFLIATVLITIVTSSCKSQKTSTFWVNSQKAECQSGEALTKCLQITKDKNLENPQWEYFYAPIEGFTFKQGVFQKIEVKETKIDLKDVEADASSIKFTLLKVLEEKQDARFALYDIWAAKKVLGNSFSNGDFKTPTLEINVSDMKVFGNDGCNTFRGSLTKLSSKEITFGPMMATKKYCGDDNISRKFNKALSTTVSYTRKGNDLFFYDADGNETLHFNKVD